MRLRYWLVAGVGFALGVWTGVSGLKASLKQYPERWLLLSYKAQMARKEETEKAIKELNRLAREVEGPQGLTAEEFLGAMRRARGAN